MEKSSFVAPKHPQQLIFENVNPATRLLEKRRQMYEVQDALDNQKARFAKDEEEFKRKEEKLRTTDLGLQQQLFKFNKFLQDNEAKKRRAETRAAEEAAQIRQKEEEILDLERELEDSRKLCAELEEEVAKNMQYELFLEMVKDTCDEYSEIQDLVIRYETLESAHKDLMATQQASKSQSEEIRNEFREYKKQQEMEMLAMANQNASLQSELDAVTQERKELQQIVEEATQADSEDSLHFGQILMSVENLYLRCCTRRKNLKHGTEVEEDSKKDEPEADDFKRKQQSAIKHLRVISNYLKDFKDIVDDLKSADELKAKKGRKLAQGVRQNVTYEANPGEPDVKFHSQDDARGDRVSHGSGSQSNTKDLTSTRLLSTEAGHSRKEHSPA